MKLSTLRKRAKLSMRQLGEQIGSDHSTISLWETGKRTPGAEWILRLAGALKTDPATVLRALPRR